MEKTDKLILASIFVVPISSVIPIKGTIIWYPQLLALLAVGLACMAMSFWKVNKYISIFMLYLIFSYLFICNQSPRAMLCLITGYSAMMFAYLVIRSKVNVAKAILVLTLANVVYVLLQVFNLDPLFKSVDDNLLSRTVGFMGSRNQLGIFQAFASTLLLQVSPWLVLLAFPILVIKGSSTFIGLCAGLNTFLFFKGFTKTAIVIFILLICLAAAWVRFSDKSIEITERYNLWKLNISQAMAGKVVFDDTAKVVTFNPLFGVGLGNYFVFSPHSQKKIIYMAQGHRYEHAHNDLVEAFFELGYVGFALLVLSILAVGFDFLSYMHWLHPSSENLLIYFCSLVTLAVCSLGVYVFHAPVSLFMFCLCLGLFYREVANAKQSQVS